MRNHGGDSCTGARAFVALNILFTKGFRFPPAGVLDEHLHRRAADGRCAFKGGVYAAAHRDVGAEKW